ncbi:RNA-binding protein 45-like [Ostrinia nubilalis]|uniref:RNA-binding protein 45-like n=1 Tax=Ostrinia furnacalis TaxID=93504 RepID=UPI00103EB7A3|nr:RNA-binding protein 45-like [Ostrinia furnacalis]
MDYRRKSSRNDEPAHDTPLHSRLFIVTEKGVTETDLRDAFSRFGHIEDIKIPRDHHTGESKGVAYIKYFKTSDAAAAIEGMNFKSLPNVNRPIKVMVAANRSEIQSEDHNEDKFKRIFIAVPNSMNEEELKNVFSEYGPVEYVRMQKDKNGESKGFAYVKFKLFSEAARAIEECAPKYRAIFAQPKSQRRPGPETYFESNIGQLTASTMNMTNSLMSAMNTQPDGYTCVNFMCNPNISQNQIRKIFDIVPGMTSCQLFFDLVNNCSKGNVAYSNPVSAAYAVKKLHNFEYPPGCRIFVKPNYNKFPPVEKGSESISNAFTNLKNAISSQANSSSPDLVQLAAAIAEASKLIKKAAAGVTDDEIPDGNDLNYCSVSLPPRQPLADIDSTVAKRCFLVCKPQPPPLPVLRDIFCRFGDLINVYTLPGKTVGYARYASAQAADNAIKTLHGAEVCGVVMKVLEAEEAPPKKVKYDH